MPALLCVILAAALLCPFAEAENPTPVEEEEPAPNTADGADDDGGNAESKPEPSRFETKLSTFEPMYFSVGWRSQINAKFQLSFKYRFVNPEGLLASQSGLFNNLHLGYVQTSLWDLETDSAPFYDTSYKPSLFYLRHRVERWCTERMRVGIQAGFEHESNGQGEDDSRSLNILYFRPTFDLGNVLGARLTIAPKIYAYVGDLSDNPDLADYRGYVDLELALTDVDGWKVAAMIRKGTVANHGSLQLDVSYPMDKILTRSFHAFVYLQYFAGWGESLRSYNEKLPSQIRLGVMVVR